MMKNDPEFNIRFVRLVEKYPQLYNNKLDSYSNKKTAEKAWREIAEALNESLSNCMSKWATLRNNFNRSLRENYRAGSGTERKSYYLSKHLQFLLPYLKARKGILDDPTPEKNQDSQEGEFNSDKEEESVVKEETNSQESVTSASEIEDIAFEEEAVSFQSRSPPLSTSVLKRKRKASLYKAPKTENSKHKRPKLELLQDSDADFFQSLRPFLDKLNESEKIRFRINVLETLHQLIDNKDKK